MPDSSISSTLANREGCLCLIWAVAQQSIVAASTFLLITAARSLGAGDTPHTALLAGLFVFSLIFVYLPNTLSLVYLQRWKLISFGNFIASFVHRNSGKSTYAHSRDKAVHEAWVTNESFTVYEHLTSLAYEMFSTLLSTCLNVIVIATLLDLRILAWYSIAGGLLAVVTWTTQGRIKSASVTAQKARQSLSTAVLSIWDNTFVGNRINVNTWRRHFNARLEAVRATSVAYDITRSSISGAAVSGAVLFIATGNALYFTANSMSVAAITALLVTLPRQVQTIQNIFQFFNVLLAGQGLRSQIMELSKVLHIASASKQSDNFVRLSDIEFAVDGSIKLYKSIDSVADLIRTSNGKRITLRGPNGSGKSTLMARMAEELYPATFYAPSNLSELCFEDENFSNASDGNRVRSMFDQMGEFSGYKFLLLDEWDANLDSTNVALLNKKIDQLAADGHVVVESRHRAQEFS